MPLLLSFTMNTKLAAQQKKEMALLMRSTRWSRFGKIEMCFNSRSRITITRTNQASPDVTCFEGKLYNCHAY